MNILDDGSLVLETPSNKESCKELWITLNNIKEVFHNGERYCVKYWTPYGRKFLTCPIKRKEYDALMEYMRRCRGQISNAIMELEV